MSISLALLHELNVVRFFNDPKPCLITLSKESSVQYQKEHSIPLDVYAKTPATLDWAETNQAIAYFYGNPIIIDENQVESIKVEVREW